MGILMSFFDETGADRRADNHARVAARADGWEVRRLHFAAGYLANAGLFALFLAVLIIGAGVAMALRAEAADRFTTPAEARTGALLLKTETEGRYVEAPRLGSDFDITVSGPTARGRLTQHFSNPTDGWVEAVYVFPLPEDSAVDTLKMVIGERAVIGEIKERVEAKKIYEQAKREGRKAALVEQERPNIFTHSVANIGPGETVVVQLEWQQQIPFAKDEFSLRLPLVVGPRYNPKPVVHAVEFTPDGGGWGKVVDPVPDRERITSVVLDPRKSAPVNPVTIKVNLRPGFELGEVKSHHHDIDAEEWTGGGRVIRLQAGVTPANRDFELTWSAKSGALPSVGLFHETVEGEDYVLAFVTPPKLDDDATAGKGANGKPSDETDVLPREIIFVIDNSGSMGGTSIRQARDSLIYGLEHLRPHDSFNVIRFDDTMTELFLRPVPANRRNVLRAKTFVSALEASGGTEMLPPMAAALRDTTGADGASRTGLRQVVFLTDGSIGNEAQLLDLIGAKRGRSRVFMVGIGSAPNSYLMTRASEIGRGTFTHIGSAAQVQDRMRDLFEKLSAPVATSLKASFDETSADATPELLPDLYRGEPVVVAAKVGALQGALKIEGFIGERPWQVTLPLSSAASGKGISKLWARRKIRDAEVAVRLGQVASGVADKTILELALAHSLVSRLTSLVAVEKDISRPAEAKLTRADLPLNLPEGWDFDKVFGTGGELDRGLDEQRAERPDATPQMPGQPRREQAQGTPDPRMQKSAFAGVAKTKKPMTAVQFAARANTGVALPQTATDAELRLIAGLILMLLAMAFGAAWKVSRVHDLR